VRVQCGGFTKKREDTGEIHCSVASQYEKHVDKVEKELISVIGAHYHEVGKRETRSLEFALGAGAPTIRPRFMVVACALDAESRKN
jgi:predicted hydrolase (HD superfamily)